MNIIPKPIKVKELDGKINFSSNTSLIGDFPETQKFAEKELKNRQSAEKNTIIFANDKSISDEGYKIDCDGKNVTISANDEAGAFYGFMTLCQLSSGKNCFNSVQIEDAPRYRHRGFMLDSARHFWKVEKVKEILSFMANIKMNIFHWHLTDDQGWRVEIKKYPLLTEKGTTRNGTPLAVKGMESGKGRRDTATYGKGMFYSQDEIRDIVAFAKERHIEIIPEIDMPGHLVAAIACYPELSCTEEETSVSNKWGILDNIGCCGKENVYTFAKDVIDELCELFPYPYFHIGGDEVPKKRWKACPKCQAKIKELGLKDEDALQGYFTNVICDYLSSKGRKTIGWNEILDAGNLNKDIIPQWWIMRKPTEKLELKWLANGGKMILTHHDYVYMDHAYAMRPLKKTYNYGPHSVKIADDSNILGIEAPQWTEYIRTEKKLDLNTTARLLAISEVAWTTQENKNYDDFIARLEAMREYFKTLGIRIAPKKVYTGKTVFSFFGTYGLGWKKWVEAPDFELPIAEKYGF